MEALDQALIHSQSLIAARMQESLSEKQLSIKSKAKDQILVYLLSKNVLHKQPSSVMKNMFFKRW